VRYTIRHTFNLDADSFWEKLFFDPAYNEALFKGHLGFEQYKVAILDKKPDGSVHRRTECVPKVEMPTVAKKLFGEKAGYTEDGHFDPKTKRFTVNVTPSVAADRVKTTLTMWVEPRGDKRVERIVEVDSSVKVLGIGSMIEGIIEKQTRHNYDMAAEFTVRWIADKGL
jgi:hypothetical protein